jgi:hypothetical protein
LSFENKRMEKTMAQVIELLLNKHKTLNSNPVPSKK